MEGCPHANDTKGDHQLSPAGGAVKLGKPDSAGPAAGRHSGLGLQPALVGAAALGLLRLEALPSAEKGSKIHGVLLGCGYVVGLAKTCGIAVRHRWVGSPVLGERAGQRRVQPEGVKPAFILHPEMQSGQMRPEICTLSQQVLLQGRDVDLVDRVAVARGPGCSRSGSLTHGETGRHHPYGGQGLVGG